MEKGTNQFIVAARIGFYVLAVLLPFGFIPGIQSIDFGREIIFSGLALLIFIAWLLSILTSGEVTYRHSVLLYTALFFLVILGVSTFLSHFPLGSLINADLVPEKFSMLILGILLMVLAGGVFSPGKDMAIFFLVLIFAGGLSALVQAVGLLSGVSWYRYIFPAAQTVDFNFVGTINGLSLFYSALFFLTLGFLSSFPSSSLKSVTRYALFASAALFFLNLVLISFRTSWIVSLGTGIFFLGFLFKDRKKTIRLSGEDVTARAGAKKGLDWRTTTVLLFLSISVLALMVRAPLISRITLPGELSPNAGETMNIASRVLKEGTKSTLFGSGPATFGFDWGLYKNSQLNLPQMIGGTRVDLWNVRFNQGYSYITTTVATTGILGVSALLLFIVSLLIVFLRQMLRLKAEDAPFALGAFLALLLVLLSAFVYPPNFSLFILLFIMTGVLSVVLSAPESSEVSGEGERRWWERAGLPRKFWSISEKRISFENPWVVFISSLAAIFLLALSVGALYTQVNRVRAVYLLQRGTQAITEGKVGEAINLFQSAANTDNTNYRSYQALAQAHIESVRSIIARAGKGENVQQEYFQELDAGRLAAERAIALNPNEPLLWRTQGSLYELIIPITAGSEQLAFSSYQRAAELDPLNPVVWLEKGRSALTFADKVQLGFNQIPAKDQAQYANLRILALQEAEKAFAKGAEVKSDFAPAHFLLAQVALRMGNLEGAIKNTQNAKIVAPLDIGIAFQLGLLYYQMNDLDKSQEEFERAVSLNSSYSNARYFLGIIYDRKGNRDGAIQQFEEVAKFNPDNAEVQKILQNLKAKKHALDGISPPATPPEKRREIPVK